MNSRGIQQLISLARRLPPKYWIVIGVLAAGYYFAEPTIERMVGRRLPGFNDNQAAEIVDANNRKPGDDGDNRQKLDDLFDQARQDANTDSKVDASTAFPSNKSASNSQTKQQTGSSKSKPKPKLATNSDQGRSQLGILTETGRNVFTSTAGLVYTPGSHEGHRLKHILRHCEDQPNRSGPHGVFDGGKDGMLAVIDEAYIKGKKGGRGVKKENQDGKTVYTVDLGRRIGFVGGQTGKRKNRPAVTRVKMVLVGQKVITAYPTER